MRHRHISTQFSGGFLTYFLFVFILLLTWNTLQVSAADCAKAKRDWLNYRYKTHVATPVSSSYNQPVCPIPEGNSCCDKQMELDIYGVGESELSSSLANWLIPIAEQLESDSVALDYFFRSDLTAARNRLHEAFSGIYGYNYKLNHAFFFQFFTDLEDYMVGRRGDLAQLLTNFFDQLRTSIVALMEKADGSTSGVVPSDPQRINCLSVALGKQNAFDRTDMHLKDQFIQVYPPARMLVNTLAVGSRLLRTIVKDASSRPECIVAFSRIRHCGVFCGAREGAQAEVCPSACENFMKTCLSDGSSDPNKSLPRLWSRFIDALTLTTKRLERTFNFATVNKDLHIFLSEAITFVHQKYAQVKSSLIQECKSSAGGRVSGASNAPPPYNLSPSGWQYSSRLRRSADNASSFADSLLRERRQSGYPGEAWRQSEAPGWGASQQPPPRGGGGGAYQPYFQSGRRASGNPSMQQSQQPQQQHSANAPEKLNKWATQLKFYYSGVKDLFARPPSTVCAPAAQSNTACWNPPPVASSDQPRRRLAALSDLVAASDRLNVVNTKNNGDPDALESGARILAELKMRNTSTHGSRGQPSLLQPRNSGMPTYGQSHDPWRIGGNNFAPPQPPQPAAPYQPQPVGEPFSNHMNIDAAGSGYEPAGVAPQPGYPPTMGQPPYSLQPERPDQTGYPSHRAPIPAPGGNQPPPLNQRWPGAGDMESSGYGREGEEDSWNRGDLWQQPPPPSHPWEQPPPPAPGSGGTGDGGNYQWPNSYYPDQQGSGEPFLPGPEAYPQPVETPTTTSTTSISTTSGPATVASESPFTIPPTPASSVESTSGVNISTIQTLPPPPPPPPSIGGFDDEDFGQPTQQPQPLPTSTQRPWDARQPSPPFGPETSGYYPGGEGASRPLGPHAPLPPPQGPPDCSPEAMASAGSGVDPRCLSERGGVEEGRPAYPHAGLPGWEPQPPDLEDHRAGSGGSPDGFEPPPPPPHYPGYVDESHPREPTDYVPDLDGLIPQTETSLPPTGPETYQPHPSASKPLDTTPPTRVAPPDVWLPVPELQPGDGKLPDSKLFLPDFPPHRGRPMSGDSKVTTGGSMVNKTPAMIATLLVVAILV